MSDDPKRDSESPDEPSFADMLDGYDKQDRGIQAGSRVKAQVMNIGKENIFLQLGQRAEGMVSRADFLEDGELEVAEGDEVEVYVTGQRDGIYECARRVGGGASQDRHADQDAALVALDEARVSGVPLEGTVKETNKGGFVVLVMGQRAFCPISQIDITYCEDPAIHIGRSYTFVVTQIKGKSDVVVSRRRLLEREAEIQAQALWETLEEGQVVEGTIASIQKYGAFVELGGTQGLLHVSELGYERVEDPGSVLQVGQSVKVGIKSVDRENKRIGLSLKLLMDDPWVEAAASLAPEQLLTGTVVRLAPFGAFVELFKGVDGLLHISELGQGKRLKSPREAVEEGQKIEVRVISVDGESRRISLGLPGGESKPRDGAQGSGPAGGISRSHIESGGFGTFADLLGGQSKK